MTGNYYNRREDETPGVVADAAFAALVQLFVPFLYQESTRTFKKSLYFFIDRELFAYTDVINLTFYKTNREEPLKIEPSEALKYRFAAAYFLHCMVNRKLSTCESGFHELSGSYPDTYLMDELFKAANQCCNERPFQKWLVGTEFVKNEERYIRNSFLSVGGEKKDEIFDAARSSRFILRDVSGHYEYSWSGVRHRNGGLCIEINISYPLEEYATYEDMIRGLLKNWGSRTFESFSKEILEKYKEGMDEKIKKRRAERLAVKGSDIDISEISFEVTESFFWELLGFKRKSTILSRRFATDLELMLFTLSVGENRHTYEQLRQLRDKEFGKDTEREKEDEMKALNEVLLGYLNLGPERYMRSFEQLKDLLSGGFSLGSLLVKHSKVTIPNMPRMVIINIALDRYFSRLEGIRRLKDGRTEELIGLFRKAFIETEVKKLCLLTKEEITMLLENDCVVGVRREELKLLGEAI